MPTPATASPPSPPPSPFAPSRRKGMRRRQECGARRRTPRSHLREGLVLMPHRSHRAPRVAALLALVLLLPAGTVAAQVADDSPYGLASRPVPTITGPELV